MINKVVTYCDTCKLFKKHVIWPLVELARAMNFNNIIAMDLHQLGKRLWYLHFIDEFSRFSNTTIIKRIKILS